MWLRRGAEAEARGRFYKTENSSNCNQHPVILSSTKISTVTKQCMIQSESAPSPSVGIQIVKTSELQVTEKASLAERRANALAGALNPTWVYFDIVR